MLGWTFPSVALFLGLHIVLTCQKYGRIHPVFYNTYLHPHIGPVPTRPSPPLLLDDNAAGEFEVENTLNSYLGRYVTKHLIKWLSCSVFEAIWEPAGYLAHAPDIFH